MRIIYFLIITLSTLGLDAQELVSPSVIASANSFSASASGSLDFTIGELAVATFRGDRNSLTEGFHQGTADGVVATGEYQGQVFDFHVYPNPMNQVLNLEASVLLKDTTIKLFNSLGQIVVNERLELFAPNHYRMDIGSLASGIYFLSVQDTERVQIISHSILIQQ